MQIKINFSKDRLVALITLSKGKGANISGDLIFSNLMKKKFICTFSDKIIKDEVAAFITSGSSVIKLKIFCDDYLLVEPCFQVTMAPDELKATVDIDIPQNVCGKISNDILKRILKKAKIINGIVLSRLDKIEKKYNNKAGGEQDLLIAVGDSEVMAEDGYITVDDRFNNRISISRTKKEKGKTVIKELPAIVSEKPFAKGAVLITKTLTKYGKNGKTVTGKILWSKNNRRNAYDPRIAVSKNVEEIEKNDTIEYKCLVRGIGYFINNSIVEVEEVINGSFEVFLTPDDMKALISLRAPKGGDKISYKAVKDEINKKGIKVPIKEREIIKLIDDINNNKLEKVDRFVFALGKTPLHGENGKLLWNVNLEVFYKPCILENGSVDYRGGGRFPFVREGQKAGVWLLSTKGKKDGITVKGESISPTPGKAVNIEWNDFFEFKETMHNGKIAKFLISSSSGLLRLKSGQITIDPVFEIKTIDYSTGNIDFDGTIIVKESINDGFNVKCTKDLHIKGAIGACKIDCGGDVVIHGGFNGKGKGSIKAKGKVIVKFVENCKVFSQNSIYINNYSLLSSLMARDSITVGTNRVKGKIIGGHIYAWNSIITTFIGSEKSNSDAFLWLGVDIDVNNQIKHIEERINNIRNEITELSSKQSKLSDEDITIKDAIIKELDIKTIELNELVAKNQELCEKLYNLKCDSITVLGKIQAHTNIMIGPHIKKIFEINNKVAFKLNKNKIVIEKINSKNLK